MCRAGSLISLSPYTWFDHTNLRITSQLADKQSLYARSPSPAKLSGTDDAQGRDPRESTVPNQPRGLLFPRAV